MRFLAALFLCLAVTPVLAKPSPHGAAITQFSGDRYIAPAPVAQKRPVVRHTRSAKVRYFYRVKRWPAYRARPLRADPPLTLAQGAGREFSRAIGRPRAWCGWWLGQHLGMPDRKLWLARNWANVGSSAGGPRVGAVVVWRHHVGIITGRSGDKWIVKSGNDSHTVRERVRSLHAAIAFRWPTKIASAERAH